MGRFASALGWETGASAIVQRLLSLCLWCRSATTDVVPVASLQQGCLLRQRSGEEHDVARQEEDVDGLTRTKEAQKVGEHLGAEQDSWAGNVLKRVVGC